MKDVCWLSCWVVGKNYEFFVCKNIYSFVFDMMKFEYVLSYYKKVRILFKLLRNCGKWGLEIVKK